MDLVNRLGIVVLAARNPCILAQRTQVLEHELDARWQLAPVDETVNTIKVFLDPCLKQRDKKRK